VDPNHRERGGGEDSRANHNGGGLPKDLHQLVGAAAPPVKDEVRQGGRSLGLPEGDRPPEHPFLAPALAIRNLSVRLSARNSNLLRYRPF